MEKQYRFILLGSGTNFTCQVLRQLLSDNLIPFAYVQHGTQPIAISSHFANIPVINKAPPHAMHSLLTSSHIPMLYHQQLQLAQWIRQQDIDFLLVACWPELIGMDVIGSVNCAALNLHPSLLPAFRGFDPISDQLHANKNEFGISLHLLNECFDCGDIVLQQAITADRNPERNEVETRCARQGAKLFHQAMRSFSQPGWSLKKQETI